MTSTPPIAELNDTASRFREHWRCPWFGLP